MALNPLEWLHDESGAVTVDWVVLAAAVVGLGVASAASVRSGAGSMADNVETALTSAHVVQLGCLAGGGPASWDCYGGPLLVELIDAYMTVDDGGYITYLMSDGQHYTITWAPGNPDGTWADADGNPVEAPPPME